MNYSVEFKKQYLTHAQREYLYDYADWLEDNVGREWDMWQWKFFGLGIRGVLFYLEEDAAIFKLKFSA